MKSISCPRCGGAITTLPRYEHIPFMGAFWLLMQVTVGALRCKTCGRVERSELADDDLARLNRMSLEIVLVVVLVLVVIGAIVGANIEWNR